MRVLRTAELLRDQKALELAWAAPLAVQDASLERAHTRAHLDRLGVASDFDADTPFFPGIGDHARRGVGSALRALEVARSGNSAFSLMRPPGHHATRNQAMGFCYLSTMAIAVLEARASGVDRIGVLDFDVHHGNGTEDILLGSPGVSFASIHQHPCYPGTGTSDVGHNCFNFPVAPGTPRLEWRSRIEQALERILRERPEVLAVSAGFDAYVRDPLANGTLEREDFHWIGQKIRAAGIPHFSLLEGGYSADLPDLVLHYLLGLEGR